MNNKTFLSVLFAAMALMSFSTAHATVETILKDVSVPPVVSPEERSEQINQKREEWINKRVETKQKVHERKEKMKVIHEKRRALHKEMNEKRKALHQEYKEKHRELMDTIKDGELSTDKNS